MSEGRDVRAPDPGARRVALYLDAEGNRTDDPGRAVRGEILEYETKGSLKRVWFHLDEVEIKWLPVGESAFLMWVLVLLLAVWVAIGIVLHLF